MTVVEERNKNRHPPRIARNSSDHRRGAVIGDKGTRAHQDHFPGSRVLVLSSLMSSILVILLSHFGVYWLYSHNHPHVVVRSSSEWLVRSWWYAHCIYMRTWFRDRRVFWLILDSDQNVADLILGIHCHMLSIHSVLPCTNVLLRKIGWLVLETSIGQLAEEDWVSCLRSLPP